MHRRPVRLALICAFALALGATAAAAQQGGTKVGFVNSRAILAATPGFAAAESTYTLEMAGFRTEVERLQATLDSASADFDQKSVMLSATAKTAKRRELEAQRDQMERRTQELRDKAGQRQQELLAPIYAKVGDAIESIREQGAYAMIFDVSANSALIVAVDKALDLTEQVIAKIKAAP